MAHHYTVFFPDDFDLHAFEIEAKGVYTEVRISANGHTYKPTFFDPVRLRREYEDELATGAAAYVEASVVVIPRVNRQNIEAAIGQLARANFEDLMPERA